MQFCEYTVKATDKATPVFQCMASKTISHWLLCTSAEMSPVRLFGKEALRLFPCGLWCCFSVMSHKPITGFYQIKDFRMYSTTISAADVDMARKVRLGRLSRPVQYIMQTHLLKKKHTSYHGCRDSLGNLTLFCSMCLDSASLKSEWQLHSNHSPSRRLIFGPQRHTNTSRNAPLVTTQLFCLKRERESYRDNTAASSQ